jgi:short-subunit dehydrogenase
MQSDQRPVALVTGASAGIGRAFAERLAREGHDLIVVARREDRLRNLADLLRAAGGVDVEVLAADLTDRGPTAEVARRVAAEPRLEILVNNAGFGGYRPFVQVSEETAAGLIDVHVWATTQLSRAALPGMIERGTGAIVNVASLLAFSHAIPPDPLPYRAVYAASKSYVVAFSFLLSREVAGSGVKVQVCCPGLVETEFHALVGADPSRLRGRTMTPQDVVQASLRSLETGETLCAPGLDDPAVVDVWLEAQTELMRRGNTPIPADRYSDDPAGPDRVGE